MDLALAENYQWWNELTDLPIMLPKWRRRALVYKLFGAIPGGAAFFAVIRRQAGGLRDFDIAKRHYAVREMVHLLRNGGKLISGRLVVEIGSGWHPVLPVLFYGLGAAHVVMTDIARHMNQSDVEKTVNYCLGHSREIADLTGVGEEILRERWKRLYPKGQEWSQVWQAEGISYFAPFDFTQTGWKDRSVDMIFSNGCLAYIPTTILDGIFRESARLLVLGGWIAHNVHVYDDYAGTDSSISPVNFLYYSEADWDWLGNCRLHYQNRCRPKYYETLAEKYGLTVVRAERLRHNLKTQALDRHKLAPEFRGLPDDELLCRHLLLMAEKVSEPGTAGQ